MKKALSTLLLAASAALVGAQELPGYLPKAPEAASIDKFVDIPPGSYTGVTGYSVPLYTIEVEGYSIPITLNYHGMGIKVDEVSSSVGLGWSLSVGGISLSRQVMGTNDNDISSDDFNAGFALPVIEPTDKHVYTLHNSSSPASNFLSAQNMYTKTTELQPDYYSYSLLHNSGKFIVDNIGEAQTIPKDDIATMGADHTVLLDSHGIEYRFVQQHDNTSISGTGGAISASAIPSYAISEIIFPSGRSIDFEYIDSVHSYLANHTETNQRYAAPPGSQQGYCEQLSNSTSRVTYAMTEKVLSRITYDNAEIELSYDATDRADIGGKRLESVKVRSLSGASSNLIRDYRLTASYYSSPPPPVSFMAPTDPLYDGLVKRMRLDGVEELRSGRKFTFDYYDGHGLPHRFSKATDFWGLYNGKEANQSYIHQYTYWDIDSLLRVEGSDKGPDLNFAQSASLRAVHLPTGGKQEFAYELDDYKLDATENQFYKREHTAAVTSGSFGGSYAVVQLSSIAGPDYRDGFDYSLEFYWSANPLQGSGGLQGLPAWPYVSVELLDQNDNLVQRLYHNTEVDISLLSPTKTYKLRFYRSSGALPGSASVWAKLRWYQNNPVYVANKQAGNLRTKSIKLFGADGALELERNYSYRHPVDTLFSSGSYREFDKSYYTEAPGMHPDTSSPCKYLNRSNSYDVNTGTFAGKSVVYEYVREEHANHGDGSKSYHIARQFSLPTVEGIPQPLRLPKPPQVHSGFKGGLLLGSKTYDSSGTLVSEAQNDYQFDNHFNADSYNNNFGNPPSVPNGVGFGSVSGGMLVSLRTFGHYIGDNFTTYNYNYFLYPSTWVKLMERRQYEHFNGSTLETTSTYGYDAGHAHIRPATLTTTASNGDQFRDTYLYTDQALKDANRVAVPTETLREKKSGASWISLGKEETQYRSWGNGVYEPELVKTGKENSFANVPTQTRLEYHRYDALANPLEVSLGGGPHTAYIWGYNSSLPVAKIENATYAQIEALPHFGPGFTIAQGLSQAQVSQLLSLQGAQVTVYEYDPLVGPTSTTDAKGYRTTYEYDSAGRLKRAKDQDGNVLSEYDYNYKD